MNCAFCNKILESVSPKDNQPYNGGYVEFTFCYGSCKFDNAIGMTSFSGYICDDCAEKYTGNMIERRFDTSGNELHGKDFENGYRDIKDILKIMNIGIGGNRN